MIENIETVVLIQEYLMLSLLVIGIVLLITQKKISESISRTLWMTGLTGLTILSILIYIELAQYGRTIIGLYKFIGGFGIFQVLTAYNLIASVIFLLARRRLIKEGNFKTSRFFFISFIFYTISIVIDALIYPDSNLGLIVVVVLIIIYPLTIFIIKPQKRSLTPSKINDSRKENF